MPQDQCRISGLTELKPGTHYNYTRLGHTLIKAAIRPAEAEVAALRHGRVTFGVYVEDRVLFFLCNLGAGWSASHYNWWLNLPELRPAPQNELEARDQSIPIEVRLVNAANGATEAENIFRLPGEAAIVLKKCVCDQIETALDPWDHLETARKVLTGAPNLKGLLRQALWIVSCRPLMTDESTLWEKRYGCRMV